MYQEIDVHHATQLIGESDILGKVTDERDFSEMVDEEHAFLRSLLCQKKPKKVLEIGVSAGGTTAVILETLSRLGEAAECYSVDISPKWYKNSKETDYDTGFLAERAYQHLDMTKIKHSILLGDTIVHHLEQIGGGIDFVVLDTVHRLPGEVLDFIAILPFLARGCIVVLHDVLLNLDLRLNPDGRFNAFRVTGLLAVCASGNKLVVAGNDLANIRGIEITEETTGKIKDIFLSLFVSWAYMPPAEQLSDYCDFIKRYYPPEYLQLFVECIDLQGRVFERANARKLQAEAKANAEQKAIEAERKAAAARLKAVYASRSYRLGRFFTFIPRKIKGGLRCIREHGFIYTVQRLLGLSTSKNKKEL